MKHQIGGGMGDQVITYWTFVPDSQRARVRIPLKMDDCDLSLQAEAESVMLFTVNTIYNLYMHYFLCVMSHLRRPPSPSCHKMSRLA